MRSFLVVCLLVATSGVARAQDASIAGLDALRERAAARGWSRGEGSGPSGPFEAWCARPPCGDDADRYELHVVDGALVLVRLVLADAADGFSLDATWQTGGSFGFRFVHEADTLDLTWELDYEPPGLSVGFSARQLDDMVALDPDDGTHAFALWIARELSRYLSSATSLRDTALAARSSLRRSVAEGIARSGTIREGTFAECFEERSTPQGTGFFDVCPMRMATADEQRAVLTTLDARLARERAILRGHFRAFHRVLVETLAATPPH
jgi:hypothetical protein